MIDKGKYGVIAAMNMEAEHIVAAMHDAHTETVGGIRFTVGRVFMENEGGEIGSAKLIVAVCGIGKVFAAMCAQTMIVKYAPKCVINTGVAGTLSPEIGIGDVVIASDVVQHDMDTSPIGDPVGWISGLDTVKMHSSDRLSKSELKIAAEQVLAGTDAKIMSGVVATGDQFIADAAKKKWISETFGAVACEMEGGAVGQVCEANNVPFAVIRSISDGADGAAVEDYPSFARHAAEISAKIVLRAATLIW